MPSIGLLVLGAAAIGIVLRARYAWATVAMLLAIVLLPSTLPLPVGPAWLGLPRLVLWAYTFGLLRRVRQGEIAADVLRPGRVHVALAAFLGAAFLIGVVLLVQPAPRFESGLVWLTLLDQALVLVAVLAAARHLGAWWVARVVVVAAAGLGAIAVAERFLGANWNHFFYQGVQTRFLSGSARLGERGGALRVRGPSQFALEFGWVCAALVPLAAVVATRSRLWAWRLLPGLLVLASVWTVSRSSVAGIALGVVVMTVTARDRRVTMLAVLGAVVAGGAYLQVGGLSSPFQGASPDSEESRYRRFAIVTEDVLDRPLLGIGLSGPRAREVLGTDTSYMLFYATIGVIGLTMFLIAVAAPVLSMAQGVRGPPSDDRVLVAGATGGVLALLLGTAFFDAFTVAGSSRLFWVLAAIGVAGAERGRVRAIPPALTRRELGLRACAPAVGVCLGLALANGVPTHTTYTAAFDVISPDLARQLDREPTFIGRVLITTACDALDGVGEPGVSVECVEPRQAASTGSLRIEGRDPAAVEEVTHRARDRLARHMPDVRIEQLAGPTEGRPTWATTAPVSLGLAGLAAGLLLPLEPGGPRPRRTDRRSRETSGGEGGLAGRGPRRGGGLGSVGSHHGRAAGPAEVGAPIGIREQGHEVVGEP